MTETELEPETAPEAEPAPASRHSVDRLSVLDGVVIAVGWCDGAAPELVIGDRPIADQAVLQYARPDLRDVPGGQGFRIAAVLPNLQTVNAEIGLRFEDGTVSRRTASRPVTLSAVSATFLEAVSARPGASLLEIGSRARSGNTYRHLFPNLGRYVGLDVTSGENVDVVADAHTMSDVLPEPFDFAYSVSVFEHLLMPWVAAVELNRVLKPGGMAFVQSHPAWPLHEEPWDFFRFSRDAWKGLFNPLTGFEIVDTAYDLEASIVPAQADAEALQGLDTQPTYLLSACVVRKVGEPRVAWRADPSEVYDLAYAH